MWYVYWFQLCCHQGSNYAPISDYFWHVIPPHWRFHLVAPAPICGTRMHFITALQSISLIIQQFPCRSITSSMGKKQIWEISNISVFHISTLSAFTLFWNKKKYSGNEFRRGRYFCKNFHAIISGRGLVLR